MQKKTLKNFTLDLLSFNGIKDMKDYVGTGRLVMKDGKFVFEEKKPAKRYQGNPIVAQTIDGKVFEQKNGIYKVIFFCTEAELNEKEFKRICSGLLDDLDAEEGGDR